MSLRLGSADLDDEAFLSALRTGRLESSKFHHADHLRLAWLAVHKLTLTEAEEFVCSAIKGFAERHGASHKYNQTVTVGWVRLIATHRESTFEEFLTRNEHQLNQKLLLRFWTASLLGSDLAKSQWIEPDRQQLPE